ncbi:MAG: hypothetical protein JXB03_04020 [Spirochaetales bacterium]|nr:hypothetical protein [Spirochaetales bacterium]
MRISPQICVILTVFLFFSAAASPLDLDNREVEQYIHNIRTQLPPRTVGGFLVFSQAPKKYTRYVGISFAHEDFRTVHIFEKNRHGVFFLAYPAENIPEHLESVTYRLVADGLWMTDTSVQHSVKDDRGVRLSVLPLEPRERTQNLQTQALGGGYARFYLKAPPGSAAALLGDFNGFNPFTHLMTEISPGLFSVTIRTYPGKHIYTYAVDGELVDVNRIDERPENRVFVRTLGARALILHIH